MSDIRAQSRRDAEFDRLLDRMDTPTYPWVEPLVRDAYEMGKRHGREMEQQERMGATKPPEVKP